MKSGRLIRILLIGLGIAISGLAVGSLFGLIGAALTGNNSLRQFGPLAGLASAIIAWFATAKDRQ